MSVFWLAQSYVNVGSLIYLSGYTSSKSIQLVPFFSMIFASLPISQLHPYSFNSSKILFVLVESFLLTLLFREEIYWGVVLWLDLGLSSSLLTPHSISFWTVDHVQLFDIITTSVEWTYYEYCLIKCKEMAWQNNWSVASNSPIQNMGAMIDRLLVFTEHKPLLSVNSKAGLHLVILFKAYCVYVCIHRGP